MHDRDWTGFGTGVISDCMGRFGGMDGGIIRIAGTVVAGPATTVQVVAGENGTIHRRLGTAQEGSVLVVAAGGSLERAVWGEVLASAARSRRIAGVVIDGAVRDVDRIREIGLPTFARGTCPSGPHKGWPGRVDEPIACGGVVVRPGDIVVGDGDGVVVIPTERADTVFELAAERQQLEKAWLDRIAHGDSTLDILQLSDEES